MSGISQRRIGAIPSLPTAVLAGTTNPAKVLETIALSL